MTRLVLALAAWNAGYWLGGPAVEWLLKALR